MIETKKNQGNGCVPPSPAIAPDAEIEARVHAWLDRMTLAEKVGQMTQLSIDLLGKGPDMYSSYLPFEFDEEMLRKVICDYKVGSILNTPSVTAVPVRKWNEIVARIQELSMEAIGIPTVYGIDAMHGETYTAESSLFPQAVAMAATFDRRLVRRGAEHAACEVRASNIPWTFAPVLDLGREPRWSRMWETLGEDCFLASELGRELVLGFQGDDPNHIDSRHVAACLKHYMGYSVPDSGKDRTPASISPLELREKHFAPYVAAIRAGALSVMVNSASVNGIPLHAHYELLTEWLKEGLSWDGVVVTDWNDVNNLWQREKIAHDRKEAIEMAINAGIDMMMVPYEVEYCTLLSELAEEGRVPMERIDDAVARVLRMKLRLGLFEKPDTLLEEYPEYDGSAIHDAIREAACECMTLLKNRDGILPLNKDARILVTGPNADSMRPLCGGWSYSWQGEKVDEFLPGGVTILKAMQARGGARVTYAAGVEYDMSGRYDEELPPRIEEAVTAAADVDCIVLCLGENSYCETPGNLDDLALSAGQRELARAMVATGKPVVLVLSEGRPRLISEIEPGMSAVLQSYLPGNEGGNAVAAVLYGEVNPGGKLPYTYPRYSAALTTYDHKHSESVGQMEGVYDYDAQVSVQWPFGYGLSYTTFEYSDLKLETPEFGPDDRIEIGVTVTNTGERKGKESVLLFINDDVAGVIPDAKRLRDFTRVELEPGESREVCFGIPASRLAFVGRDGKWVLEKGTFTVQVGPLSGRIVCGEGRKYGFNIL